MTYPGHEVLMETLDVPYGPDHYSALKHDFLLRQMTTTPPWNHSLHLEAGGAVTRPTWMALGVALGLVAVLRSLID